MKSVIIAACLALLCVTAWAKTPADFSAVDAKLKACLSRHGDTPGVDTCYGVAKVAADRRLNDVYADLVSTLRHPGDPVAVRDGPEILRRLVAAERAWIVFRDAECSYDSSYMLRGTGEDGADTACVYAQTKMRIIALTGRDAPVQPSRPAHQLKVCHQ